MFVFEQREDSVSTTWAALLNPDKKNCASCGNGRFNWLQVPENLARRAIYEEAVAERALEERSDAVKNFEANLLAAPVVDRFKGTALSSIAEEEAVGGAPMDPVEGVPSGSGGGTELHLFSVWGGTGNKSGAGGGSGDGSDDELKTPRGGRKDNDPSAGSSDGKVVADQKVKVAENQKECPVAGNRAYIRHFRDLSLELDFGAMTAAQEFRFVFQPRDAGTGRGLIASRADQTFPQFLNDLQFQEQEDGTFTNSLGLLFHPETNTFVSLPESPHRFEGRTSWCAVKLQGFHKRQGHQEGEWDHRETMVLVPRDDLLADEEGPGPAVRAGAARPPKWLALTGKQVRLVGRKPQSKAQGRAHRSILAPRAYTSAAPRVEVFLSNMEQVIMQYLFSGGPDEETLGEILRNDPHAGHPTFVTHKKAATWRNRPQNAHCEVVKHLPLYGPHYAETVDIAGEYLELDERAWEGVARGAGTGWF